MQGIEISRAYFEQYGRELFESQFSGVRPFLAFGIAGSGSECFGFDDEVSRDHDFEPGFCIFLPDEETESRRDKFLLERAYAKLPKVFMELKRSLVSPVGGNRRGVIRISDFLKDKTGTEDGRLGISQWLSVPSSALAEAVNGEIFEDHFGEITRIRKELSFYPGDIMLKKLAGHLLMMGQSGQYNYMRMLAHGEAAAAQMAVFEFVKHAVSALFLLNGRYEPYYKWAFRALRQLPLLSYEAELMEYLITSDNDQNAEEKQKVMEGIAMDVIDVLKERDMSEADCQDLEKHAYSVNDRIHDPQIRNLHILAGI